MQQKIDSPKTISSLISFSAGFAFLLAVLWSGGSIEIAIAQSSPEATTTSPIAYVYVQTKKGVDVFSASTTGRLTKVKGSLFADTGQMGAINGAYMVSVGTNSLFTYPIEANGAIGKRAFELNTAKYDGSACGTNLGGALFDHTGKYVYVLLSAGNTNSTNPCSALQSYKIESNGDLTFLGESVVHNDYHGMNLPEGISTISGSDMQAYGVYSDIYTDEFTAYTRESAGALMANGSFKEVDPKPNPLGVDDNYFPMAVAADPTNHLAVVVTESFASNPPAPQLASYTINSNGSITSTNAWNNMPTPAFYPNVIAMSWTGKKLAVAGAGIEIFNFNGAAPMTKAASLPLSSRDFSQMAWDKNNHLYALDYRTGNLYVYTVTSSGITAAPGSPYSIPYNTQSYYQYGLIVVPK